MTEKEFNAFLCMFIVFCDLPDGITDGFDKRINTLDRFANQQAKKLGYKSWEEYWNKEIFGKEVY